MASRHESRLCRGIDSERLLLVGDRAPGAPLHATPAQEVDGSDRLRGVDRVAEFVRRERDAEAEADLVGDLRQRGEERAVRGHVRPLDAEVVLDDPHGAEAELVGQLDLLDRLEVRGLLGLALVVRIRLVRPRLRGLHLIEEIQLHGQSPIGL